MKNRLVGGIKSINNLYCKTGRENGYRMAFLRGKGGSRKEESWDRIKNKHSCCGSMVSWRHRVECYKIPLAQKMQCQPYQIDPNLEVVRKYKKQGKTTAEISKLLPDCPLEKINNLYILTR